MGAAQSVIWSAAPGVFVDTDFGGANELGPAVVLGAAFRADRRLASGVTTFAQDQMTGLVNQILDPNEGDLGHHFVLGVGVYFW